MIHNDTFKYLFVQKQIKYSFFREKKCIFSKKVNCVILLQRKWRKRFKVHQCESSMPLYKWTRHLKLRHLKLQPCFKSYKARSPLNFLISEFPEYENNKNLWDFICVYIEVTLTRLVLSIFVKVVTRLRVIKLNPLIYLYFTRAH